MNFCKCLIQSDLFGEHFLKTTENHGSDMASRQHAAAAVQQYCQRAPDDTVGRRKEAYPKMLTVSITTRRECRVYNAAKERKEAGTRRNPPNGWPTRENFEPRINRMRRHELENEPFIALEVPACANPNRSRPQAKRSHQGAPLAPTCGKKFAGPKTTRAAFSLSRNPPA